ncbi:MAG: hypothetical protein QXQ53_01115 [Candidatus Methanosuratincola sp.]
MKKNVANQVVSAHLINKTDGSDVTSGTTTVYVTIDGGTQATGQGTVTHKGNGEWVYQPTQSETNGEHIIFTFVNSSAISVGVQVNTDYPQTGDAYAIVNNATYGNSALNDDIDTLLSRLTSTRAGYLDNLPNLDTTVSSRAPESGGNIASIKAKTDQLSFTVTNRVDANVTHVSGTSQTARDLGANIDTTISSRAPESGGNISAIKAKTDQLTFTTPNQVDATAMTVNDKTEYNLSSDQSGVTIGTVNNLGANAIDAIWDEVKTGHNTTNSYGKIIGDNLDAMVSSRAPASTALSNAVWTDTKAGYLDASISSRGSASDVSAIKAKTDQLTFTTANRVDATAVAVNDKTDYNLSADQSSVTIGTVNSLGTQAKIDVETKCGDALNTAFDDSTSLTTNGLKDRIRTLTWILRNKLVMTKATGDGILYKDDNTTQAFNVSGLITDDSTYITRKRLQ